MKTALFSLSLLLAIALARPASAAGLSCQLSEKDKASLLDELGIDIGSLSAEEGDDLCRTRKFLACVENLLANNMALSPEDIAANLIKSKYLTKQEQQDIRAAVDNLIDNRPKGSCPP